MKRTGQYRVIVHPSGKGWTWTQVSRNGRSGAVAPAPFDNKANAVRAGRRQVDALNSGFVEGEPMAATLVVDEKYSRT